MKTYRNLVIEAALPDTAIWLGDKEGHFVQKEMGTLNTDLLEGDYTVEFGLGSMTYPIRLRSDSQYTEEQIKRGPSCPRPIPNVSDSSRINDIA